MAFKQVMGPDDRERKLREKLFDFALEVFKRAATMTVTRPWIDSEIDSIVAMVLRFYGPEAEEVMHSDGEANVVESGKGRKPRSKRT